MPGYWIWCHCARQVSTPGRNNPRHARTINDTVLSEALCCKIPKKPSRHFTGYGMRTGATTHMEVVGIAEDVQKIVGKWLSRGTASQLLSVDQFGNDKEFGIVMSLRSEFSRVCRARAADALYVSLRLVLTQLTNTPTLFFSNPNQTK